MLIQHTSALETQQERWLPVVGWENIFEVSDLGRLRRLVPGRGTRAGRILSGSRQRDGYVKIVFRARGRTERDWLHRVVARAFLGPIPEGHEVNHKDLKPANNRADNFEFVTHQGNIQHAVDNGALPRGEQHARAVLTVPLVRAIRAAHDQGMGGRAIAVALNLNRDTVYSVLQGKSWKHVT